MEYSWIFDVLAILLSLAAFVLSICQFCVERNRNRKEATIHAFDKLEESEAILFLFKATKKEIDDLVKWKTKSNHPKEQNTKKAEEWEQLSKALPLIEHFAVGINNKIYDIDTLNSMAGNLIISTYSNCEELIKYKRKGWGKGKNYAEFEEMAKALISHRKRHGQSTP